MNQTKSSPNVQLLESISDREREILALIARHHTNKEIAGTLNLALSTVKWYTKRIYGKLTVKGRREAVKRATELGILGTDQPESKPNNLPSTPTIFIGREEEVEEIVSLLIKDDIRLVTLHGPGGIGKTRLAIQAASKLVKLGDTVFPNGIWHVSLASLQNPDLIPQSIGNAIGYSYFDTHREHLQQIVDYFQGRNLLLILDNFEHLISIESTRLIAEIITHTPRIKILVTSRIRLNVEGEQLFPVGGLKTPRSNISLDMDWEAYSAIQLFVRCARRVQPKFEVNEQNLEPIIKVCQLVEGMPLGIELASSWLEILSPHEIAAEIIRSMDFLETNQTGATDRHRSIRAVFDSSWKLLSENERGAFLRLSVFVGSFSRDAAQNVSGASLQTLLRLANKSWLQQIEGGRFQLHELMRQYGEERLKADPSVWKEIKNRHADYFADFVAKQSERMKRPDQRIGAEAVKEEFDTNIRTAWDWLAAEQRWVEITDHMLTGLTQITKVDDRFQALLPWLQGARLAITNPSGGEHRLAFAILGACEVDIEIGSEIAAADYFDRLRYLWKLVSEHELDEAMGLWFALLASRVWRRNFVPDAQALLGKAIDRLREPGKEWELGWALLRSVNVWGVFLLEEDKIPEAEKKLMEVEKLFRKIGAPFEQGRIAQLRGDLAVRQYRPIAEVETHYQRAKDFYRALGEHFYISVSGLARYYLKYGETEKTFEILRDQQREYERVGNLVELADSLHWDSIQAVRYSSYDHAVTARQRCISLYKKLGYEEAYPANFAFNLYELGEVYRVFGETDKAIEAFECARVKFEQVQSAQGLVMEGLGFYQRSLGDMALQAGRYSEALDHFINYNELFMKEKHLWGIAQSHGKLALAYAYLGDPKAARAEMRESLTLSHSIGQFDLKLIALLAEPVCLIKEGKHEFAVELAAFIAHHPVSWNETKWQAQDILDWAAQDLPDKTVHAAVKRGEALELETVVKGLLTN